MPRENLYLTLQAGENENIAQGARMSLFRIAFLLLILPSISCFGFFIIPAHARDGKPPLPFIQPEGCEGESCTPVAKKETRSSVPLTIYQTPWGPKKINFIIPKGRLFSILGSDLYTVKAAPYRLTRQDIKHDKCEEQEQLKPGDTIYVLANGGEGNYLSWKDSKTFYCSFHQDSEKIKGKYKVVERIKVKYEEKEGWWRQPDACYRERFPHPAPWIPEWCPGF